MRLLLVTGPPGSGKTTVSTALHDALGDQGVAAAVLDADDVRRSTPSITRARERQHVAYLVTSFVEAGHDLMIVTDTIADEAGIMDFFEAIPASDHLVVRLDAPSEILDKRIRRREPGWWSGTDGLVRAATELQRQSELLACDLVIDTASQAPTACAERIRNLLHQRGFIGFAVDR